MTMSMLPNTNTGMMFGMEEDWCQDIEDYSNDTARRVAIQFSKVSESIIQPTMFSVGIITNILSILVLKGVRMNKVFRTCLLALALSDLCTTVTGLTQIFIEVFIYCGQVPQGYMFPSVSANNTLYFLFLNFVATSASLVVFIAFIRNLMYLKPLRARAFFSPRITKILCGCIFLLTFVLWTPTCLYIVWLSCYKETDNEYCNSVNEYLPNLKSSSSRYVYFVSAIYGPLMFILYIVNLVCIRVSLSRSSASLAQMTASGNESQQQKSRNDTVTRITKTLTVILVLDVICTLPALIQGIGVLLEPEDTHEKQNLFFEIIDIISEIFLAMRPTYNFWLYVFQRPEFRKRMKVLFHKAFYVCCKHKWCMCSDFFAKDKLHGQSMEMSSSLNESRRNTSHDISGATRTTPPTNHPHRIYNNNK